MSNEQITSAAELDEFEDAMDTMWVMAADAHGRPWLIYATEDGLWAASFPVEGPEGMPKRVEVGDMITRPDGLDLPLTVLWRPDAQPTVLPDVETVATHLEAYLKRNTFTPKLPWEGSGIGVTPREVAAEILTLLPGRTVQDVLYDAAKRLRKNNWPEAARLLEERADR